MPHYDFAIATQMEEVLYFFKNYYIIMLAMDLHLGWAFQFIYGFSLDFARFDLFWSKKL